jgi:hypothetical protein
MLKKLILTFFIAAFMNACHKKHDSDPVVFIPATCNIASSNTFGSTYNAYYDDHNNLTSWQGFPFTYRLEYDRNNRLIKASDDSLGILVPHYTSYHYDLNGHLDRDTIYKLTGTAGAPDTYVADSINTFTYAGNNIIRKDNIKIGGIHLYSLYSYNAAGDMLQHVDFDNSGIVTDTTIFVYDTQKSNNKALFFKDPVLASQKHNIVYSFTSLNGVQNDAKSYNARYSYTANGYVFTENIFYYDATESPVKYYSYSCK